MLTHIRKNINEITFEYKYNSYLFFEYDEHGNIGGLIFNCEGVGVGKTILECKSASEPIFEYEGISRYKGTSETILEYEGNDSVKHVEHLVDNEYIQIYK
ncbi:208_t:CDS:2 [Dentiscutata erythropus]|uniref:208_t:CDS:1 n=1 Tax=Dentiscutata erythropus TaxID=1348616 RepID=A0A9N8YRK7_9GLOM|nr:208_t:CDS:2 [Dentiscutata erythropus]